MKEILIILAIFMIFITGMYKMDSEQDPYTIGMHMDYSIKCENGFIYKSADRGYIQVLNSDGSPLRVGKKIY